MVLGLCDFLHAKHLAVPEVTNALRRLCVALLFG